MENIAKLAQVHLLPVWKKLEGEKQVRFRVSALAKMVKFVVALGRSILGRLMREGIKRLSSWHYCAIRCKNTLRNGVGYATFGGVGEVREWGGISRGTPVVNL